MDQDSAPDTPPRRRPADSESVISELMMPNQVNNLGHVFGGEVLSMVDRAAAVAAMRHAGSTVVTASIDRVDFREPIFAGELVTCRARVNFVGRTSLEVEVHVEAENLLTGVKRLTNTCYLTFVAIDREDRPIPVPRLLLETADDRRRFRAGEVRRAARLELLDRLGQADR